MVIATGADDTEEEMVEAGDTEGGTVEAADDTEEEVAEVADDTEGEVTEVAGSEEARAAADDTDNDGKGDSAAEVGHNGTDGSDSGTCNGESEKD